MNSESSKNSAASEASPVIGRNEACPCGSGKKFKRCHGVGAAPKITPPKEMSAEMAQSMDAFNQIDPNLRDQLLQSLQKLPRGQMQKLQSMIQRGMSGKDISQEAMDFEKSLPVEFQEKIRSLNEMALSEMGQEAGTAEAEGSAPEMTEEQARTLVAQAASEGKISEDQAKSLLKEAAEAPVPAPASTKGSFWSSFTKKK